MAVRIQLRRDTASNWETNNPVLALGEIGLDTTSGNFKIGNGTDQWTQLNYFSTEVEDVISQEQLDNALAAIGGDGIVFDSEEGIYNLDLSSVSQNIVPETTETYDLGSDTKRWNDLYLSGDTIFLGDIQLKDSGDGKFEVLAADGETTLETILLPGQVTDAELSDDAADLKTRFATHRDATNNPHSVTATQVGLGNVTNESKATMFTDPIFTGTVSGVTASMVGLGNVTNESKATMFTDPTFSGTVSGVTATMVGLGNVTNESKATMFTDAALTGIPTAPTAPTTTSTTQIATTAFVQGEINAAALALGTNYSVADIEERDELEDLVVGDIVFVADDGDEKWAQYKVTGIDPFIFLKIMDQDVMLNALSAENIKSSYESNEDTNAFTDELLQKLNGIEEEAKDDQDAIAVPFDDDVVEIGGSNVQNIIEILHTSIINNNQTALSHINDEDIHFTQEEISITESQISDFKSYELSDPTILKDADIGTKVQAFDATILRNINIGSEIQPFDATILKSADIGISVQGYDIDTVIDPNYETFDSSGDYSNLRARSTTAEDVGLENVENYPMSSQVQAEEGNIETKYMNPLRTKQAILAQLPIYLSSNEFINQTALDLTISSIGGDGIIWNPSSLEYDLDYATNTEASEGVSTTKVLTPANSKFITIDGGEFN